MELCLSSWESETEYQHSLWCLFNLLSGPIGLTIPRPQMAPLLPANWPGKTSWDFAGGLGMKLSTNKYKSTYTENQCQLSLNCTSLQDTFGITCWGHIHMHACKPNTHTHTHSHFYWLQHTK